MDQFPRSIKKRSARNLREREEEAQERAALMREVQAGVLGDYGVTDLVVSAEAMGLTVQQPFDDVWTIHKDGEPVGIIIPATGYPLLAAIVS